MAEKLHELPEIRAALARGEISFSAARELTRVANAENECEVLDTTRDNTVREIEDFVSGHEPRIRVALQAGPVQAERAS